MKKKIFMIIAVIALIMAFLPTFSACSKGSEQSAGNSESDGAVIIIDSDARKLVYTININITVDSLKDSSSAIKAAVKENNGWVEESNESADGDGDYTYCNYTVRIPTSKVEDFVSGIEANGKIDNKNVNTQDITDKYVNATSRKQSLLAEKQSLSDLLAGGGLSVSDVIMLNAKIADIDAEIGSLTVMINEYDSLSDYSTVNISLTQDNDKDYSWIAIMIPYILLAAAVGYIVFDAVRRNNKKKSVINE